MKKRLFKRRCRLFILNLDELEARIQILLKLMQHILLEKAFVYKKRNFISIPEGFFFDKKLGAWVSGEEGEYLAKVKTFPGGGSKKCDMETGEDQKGQ